MYTPHALTTARVQSRPSQDLEYLIEKSVDITKADYAVVCGVQIHNWDASFSPGSASLEFVAPTRIFVVSYGEKSFLDIAQIPQLTPRQVRSAASCRRTVGVCVVTTALLCSASKAWWQMLSGRRADPRLCTTFQYNAANHSMLAAVDSSGAAREHAVGRPRAAACSPSACAFPSPAMRPQALHASHRGQRCRQLNWPLYAVAAAPQCMPWAAALFAAHG